MSYQDHLQSCSYCSGTQLHKPTIKIKGASSYNRKRKLSELADVISGTSFYPTILYPRAKAASSDNKSQKLRELAMLIKGS